MAKVSVIVPVYNGKKYINKCVNSILRQTFKDIEIILVDDGSTDNTLDILREYEKKFPNVKVIPKHKSWCRWCKKYRTRCITE